jgi:dTDP-4-amino-4,6-dideoxygalactose transaminase
VDGVAGAGVEDAEQEGEEDHPADCRERQRDFKMDVKNLKLSLPPFFTIGTAERHAVEAALPYPLSGYLGGKPSTGYFINKLQDEWCAAFKVKHAIACNSATSGLLAACMAIDIGPGSVVWTTAYSMSATAACAKVLGASLVFIDIETTRFSLDITSVPTGPLPKCIIVTNLFGHPAYLTSIRSWCESNNVLMIEDNAQGPFASEDGRYAGTIGHVGVFSLNVHKHIQCGEGGVVVTADDDLASRLCAAVNHGELAGDITGLNLRMTEPTAAIACAQLAKAKDIIAGRIELAETLTDMVKDIPWIVPPKADTGCRHVYYQWAARVINDKLGMGVKRFRFTNALQEEGFPLLAGYTKPLHGVFEPFMQHRLPVVERVEYKEIMTFEVCAWDPSKDQLKRMYEMVKRAAGDIG